MGINLLRCFFETCTARELMQSCRRAPLLSASGNIEKN
jgi:hypothetical protein